MQAAEGGHAEVVKLLLEGGADRNTEDKVRRVLVCLCTMAMCARVC